MPPECDAVGVVAGKWKSWWDGVVGAGVCCGEKDLAPITSLEAHARDAGDIMSPGNVEDQVGVGRVANHRAGVNGSLGAEAGV